MKNSYLRITAWLSILPALLLPAAAFAQLSAAQTELADVGDGIGADADTDLPTLVGELIKVLLSVLGIIFVVLVVYAGFLYLTSQGEAERVKKAKALLTQAVIGLVIIISAYAISSFVIDALVQATS
ncbi:MAG: hypothetical protein HQ488_01145 [Parcubacteria group bacterium]|nr:hypothetical protein [Parcubacteria group bacterium]